MNMVEQVMKLTARSPIALSAEPTALPSADPASTQLIDLTPWPRIGLRGSAAEQKLEEAGLVIPTTPNQLSDQGKQALVLRLSAREFWILGKESDAALPVLGNQAGTYSIPCEDSHAWLVLSSPHKASILAKLCAVDLRDSAFPQGHIAQTVVAGSNAIIAHHTLDQSAVFSILCDRTVAHYLWEVLLDAMQEFTGQAMAMESAFS